MENNNENENSEFCIRVVKGNNENSSAGFVSGVVVGFFVTTLLVSAVKSSIRVLTD